jgi:predicted secreted protein
MNKIIYGLIVLLYLGGTAVLAKDLTSTNFIVRDPSIGTGGGYQSSGSFKMYSAGNLNISGNGGTSTSFIGRDGFLQYPEVKTAVITPTVLGSTITLNWTASTVANGYTVSGYNLGVATVSGGPYTFTPVGNVLTYSYINQTPGTYYFVLQTLDAFGNIIATSNEASATVEETLSFSISANAISFGPLTSAGPRYATTVNGSSSETAAHTITAESNASTGYTIIYSGSTLDSNGNVINPATITSSSTGTPGTNQFALSLLSSGTASVPTSYDHVSQNWNFAANTLATIASTSGPTAAATLDAYYIANAATLAPSGTYRTTLTYAITANY